MLHPLPRHALNQKRLAVLLTIFGLLVLYLLFFIFRLQIFDYGIYQEKVLNQITVGSSLPADRGIIYDRNGNVLAENKTVWRIYLSPVDISKKSRRSGKDYAATIADGMAELLGVDRDAVYEKATKKGYLDQTIYKNADEETTRRILLFARDNKLTAMIHAEASTTRYYPYGSLAAHVIGFTGSDNQGLFGLESYYNSVLTGTDGQYLAAVDSQGVKLPSAYTDYIEAEDGLSLVTTLDLYMQKELEHQLEQALLASDAQNRVTGVVMQVKTGDILAMATAPNFNLNDPYRLDADSEAKLAASQLAANSAEYKAYKNELLYTMWSNKAVSEIYEPGSTFKIVTVSAALETGAVSASSVFHCPGYYVVGGCRIRCHKHGGHGSLTLAQGLQQSCNPVMMQSAERMGKDNFYTYFKAFGYTEKTGIDLPGEALGISHSPSSLGSTELATSSFGQRFKVSILQQLCAVAAVANDGVLVTPHLLSSLQDKEGKTVFNYQQNDKRQVISAETASLVATILEGGVSGDGGAKNAYTEGYQIAAKTGTSEKFEILDAGGNSFLRIGSCVAFAPYDDAEIAVILVVDEPTSANKYGSATAAPYISAYLSSVLPYLGIEASYETSKHEVPSLVGMNAKDAKKLLSSSGLAYETVGEGSTVLSQAPAAGTLLLPDRGKVILYLTEDVPTVTVPSLTGKTFSEAMALLSESGLNVSVSGASPYGTVAKEAHVVSQSLLPGKAVPRGTQIVLYILHTNDSD